MDGAKLREHRYNQNVDVAITAAIEAEASTGEKREAALQTLAKQIPSLRKLGIWPPGDNSRESTETLATMLAGLCK